MFIAHPNKTIIGEKKTPNYVISCSFWNSIDQCQNSQELPTQAKEHEETSEKKKREREGEREKEREKTERKEKRSEVIHT